MSTYLASLRLCKTLEKGAVPRVRQTAYLVHRAHKLAALGRVLDLESPASALIFCRTRNEVDELAETLTARGYRAEGLHGGMSQDQRDRVVKRLRGGAADLVVATDVAARGLDIKELSHVVNLSASFGSLWLDRNPTCREQTNSGTLC